MPNKKSAKKELRKTVKRNKQNAQMSMAMKNLIKDSHKAIALGEAKVKKDITKTIKAIDKMVKKGLLKKNTASRKKSKLQKKVNKVK